MPTRNLRPPDFSTTSGTRPGTLAACFVVILAVIPPGLTGPNQTALNRNTGQPDLPRPNWAGRNRRLAAISYPAAGLMTRSAPLHSQTATDQAAAEHRPPSPTSHLHRRSHGCGPGYHRYGTARK